MTAGLDWTERLTAAVTVVFVATIALTAYARNPTLWIVWAAAMMVLAGAALVVVNRSDDGTDRSR